MVNVEKIPRKSFSIRNKKNCFTCRRYTKYIYVYISSHVRNYAHALYLMYIRELEYYHTNRNTLYPLIRVCTYIGGGGHYSIFSYILRYVHICVLPYIYSCLINVNDMRGDETKNNRTCITATNQHQADVCV